MKKNDTMSDEEIYAKLDEAMQGVAEAMEMLGKKVNAANEVAKEFQKGFKLIEGGKMETTETQVDNSTNK